MSDTPETVWELDHIRTHALEIDASLTRAHQGADPCCCLCPTCTAYHHFVAQALPAIAEAVRTDHAIATHAARVADEALRTTQHLPDAAAYPTLLEQYEALKDAHEDLLLEHQDLQTAYYLAQRALRRAEKAADDHEGHGHDDHQAH